MTDDRIKLLSPPLPSPGLLPWGLWRSVIFRTFHPRTRNDVSTFVRFLVNSVSCASAQYIHSAAAAVGSPATSPPIHYSDSIRFWLFSHWLFSELSQATHRREKKAFDIFGGSRGFRKFSSLVVKALGALHQSLDLIGLVPSRCYHLLAEDPLHSQWGELANEMKTSADPPSFRQSSAYVCSTGVSLSLSLAA